MVYFKVNKNSPEYWKIDDLGNTMKPLQILERLNEGFY